MSSACFVVALVCCGIMDLENVQAVPIEIAQLDGSTDETEEDQEEHQCLEEVVGG